MKSVNQKIFWADNIKYLRGRKKISQEVLSTELNISRSKLNAHEGGHTINPPVEDLFRFSEYFKISIDSLLKVELTKLGELKVRELEAGNDVYMAGGNIRVLAITVDKGNKENVEYVPVKAKAGYKAGYSDPEFLATLPKYSFPDLPRNGTFRLFPTVGNSMLPIPEGSDILAKYIQDWTSIKPETLCIVILKGDQDFVFKKVCINDKVLTLSSLNKNFADYVEPITNVLEIWQYERFISKQIPEKATEIDDLKTMIKDLHKEIKSTGITH